MRVHQILPGLFLTGVLFAGGAWAEGDDVVDNEAGTAEPTYGSTMAEASDLTQGALQHQSFGFIPQLGFLTYNDLNGETASRAAIGFTADMNAWNVIQGHASPWYLGPQTGLIFSHLGSTGSNFFGTNADNPVGAAGANLMVIPIDVKAGYSFSDNYRVTLHGGANLTYRSVANSLALGPSSLTPTSDWTLFPNVGGELEIGFARNIAISLRPDVTITPGNDLFTGTVGVGIALS